NRATAPTITETKPPNTGDASEKSPAYLEYLNSTKPIQRIATATGGRAIRRATFSEGRVEAITTMRRATRPGESGRNSSIAARLMPLTEAHASLPHTASQAAISPRRT